MSIVAGESVDRIEIDIVIDGPVIQVDGLVLGKRLNHGLTDRDGRPSSYLSPDTSFQPRK